MFSFIKQSINKRKQTEELKCAKKEKEAASMLEEVTNMMLSKPCPISKGACTKACVHFKQGHIFTYNKEFFLSRPKCKLWK